MSDMKLLIEATRSKELTTTLIGEDRVIIFVLTAIFTGISDVFINVPMYFW